MSSSRKTAVSGAKRNLPVWMSSRGEGIQSHEDKPVDDDSLNENNEEGGTHKKARGYSGKGGSNTSETAGEQEPTSSGQMTGDFSKLLEGVVFALSGFINPERSTLRSQALEMGAEYQPDWNSNCTLLVCAFPNTPKFRQVEAQCGTIVSKEWITECYTQKKLVDIDSHLMHAGKPWRKSRISHVYTHDDETIPSRKSQKQEEAKKQIEPGSSAQSKVSRSESSRTVEEMFSPSVGKKWAADDLKKTMKWLESQAEKPEPSEIRKVAAGGVLTCLQDAIELLEQKQNVEQLREQWSFLPHVVEELVKLEASAVSRDLILKQALFFKKIYEEELSCIGDDPHPGKGKMEARKRGHTNNKGKGKGKKEVADDYTGYDSDETIEMTEDEIDLAFQNIASKKPAISNR